MTEQLRAAPPPACEAKDDELDSLLHAWHHATDRLHQSQAALREEVRRLRGELAANRPARPCEDRPSELADATVHTARTLRHRTEPLHHYLTLLQRRLEDDAGSSDLVDKVSDGLDDLECAIEDLAHFATRRQPQLETLSLRDMIDGVRASLSQRLASRSIRLVVDVPEDALATADRTMLARAIYNLMLNATDAMPEGGELVITAVDGDRGLELEIADSGPGLSEEARSRAFEPFYYATNSGAGLRLAVVDHILEQHGGATAAMNCHEGGAAFTLRIPHTARQAKAIHESSGGP